PILFSSLAQEAFSNVVVFSSNGGDSTNALIGEALSPPVLLSSLLKGNDFIFAFLSVTGKTYVVQYKDLLSNPSWQDLQLIPGNGATLYVTNLISTNRQRFFRLSLQ